MAFAKAPKNGRSALSRTIARMIAISEAKKSADSELQFDQAGFKPNWTDFFDIEY
jgi:hypothetical protein